MLKGNHRSIDISMLENFFAWTDGAEFSSWVKRKLQLKQLYADA